MPPVTAASHPALPAGVRVLERGWLSSNSLLAQGRHGAALVDSGYWTHAAQTLALVRAVLGPDQLATLANTHLHSDHCGGNAALQQAYPRARTCIPPGLAAQVRDWDPVALTYEPTGQYCPRFGFDGLLEPGSRIALGDLEWEVHAAPGHDPHSVILFEPLHRVLVSADALWENGFGVVFQELEGERAFDAVADTLDLIEDLEPLLIVPGHGSVFTDLGSALAKARSRLDAYAANPRKHAAHAAKVLLKFKLLEVQEQPEELFLGWAERSGYFRLVHGRWNEDQPLRDWLAGLLDELARTGAAERNGPLLRNR